MNILRGMFPKQRIFRGIFKVFSQIWKNFPVQDMSHSNKRANLNRNQYTPKPTAEKVLEDLLTNRCHEVWDPTHSFKCLVPHGTGVHRQPNGYFRINYDGGKVMAHVFAFETTYDCKVTMDCSHLCGNQGCCNPEHLADENRKYNLSRRGCKGYVYIERDDETYFIMSCSHNPICKVTWRGVECTKPQE